MSVQIDSRFQQSGRVRMPQRVRGDILADARLSGRTLDRFLNRGRLVGNIRALAGEQVVRRAIRFPVRSQLRQQTWRERNLPLSVPLASRCQLHPLAVDVGRFQASRFGDSHPRTIESHQERTVFEIGCTSQQTFNFVVTENHRQAAGTFAKEQLIGQFRWHAGLRSDNDSGNGAAATHYDFPANTIENHAHLPGSRT